MASKTCVFLESGTNAQFEFVLTKYDEAIKAKANSKSSKPETLLKLDKWYQTELPKKIKTRGKEPFITHDEIVQTIKWKLARGQFRPRLKDLVQMNTPRVVMQETKKAFRALFKKNDLEAAVQALSNLKGVGPAMASAVLAAGAPHMAPFMADECLLSMPDIEGIDYTMKEYLKLVEKTKECVERLNSQGGEWTPHKVELAVWTHYIARDLKPELLDDMPGGGSPAKVKPNGLHTTPDEKKEVNGDGKPHVNGGSTTDQVNGVGDEQSRSSSSQDEDSKDSAAAVAPPAAEPETNGDSNKNGTEEKEMEVDSSKTNNTEASTEVNNTEASTEVNNSEASTETNSSEASTKADNTEASSDANNTETSAVEAPANGESTAPEKAEENGTKEPAVQENGTNGEEAKVNGEAEVNGGAEVQENGVEDKSSADSTKEENVKSTCDTPKRGLEEDEAVTSEAKRLKEDSSNPQPVQAAGV